MARRKPTAIRFFGPVIDVTINKLLEQVDAKMKDGQREFLLLMSSNGGSIFHGLSAYNYLKGIPAKITTHNFGNVDSISVIIFCSGEMRLSVPRASFMLHGASTTIKQDVQVDDRQLGESLIRMRKDLKNIAGVISEATGKSIDEVDKAMMERTILKPEDALEWGLIHETRSELVSKGVEVISIQYQQPEQQRRNS
jgi:ATP-dependent Clp protease protease subunit